VNVLLDTHVLIWWDEGRRLAAEARQAIEEAVTESGFLELPVTSSPRRAGHRAAAAPPRSVRPDAGGPSGDSAGPEITAPSVLKRDP
jgi:hypothetical protein